jgi:hypothetical protein
MTVFKKAKQPSPSDSTVNEGVNELTALLEGEGWEAGRTTMVKDLNFAFTVNNQRNVASHVTIPYGNIKAMVIRFLADGVDGAAAALTRLKAEVFFHVTLGEGDDYLDTENTRWYSKTGTWNSDDINADTEDLNLAVKKGKAALGRK